MSSVCTSWDMESLALLEEDTMDKLLDGGWEKNRRVPTPQELGMKPQHPTLTLYPPTSLLPAAVGFLLGGILSTSRKRMIYRPPRAPPTGGHQSESDIRARHTTAAPFHEARMRSL